MPSANPEKYQSKLFNFFRQKTRKWSEKVQQTVRHVKVNANWSLEAILHSAVVMMRKVVESRGKRLKPGKQSDNSPSTPESGTMQIIKPRGAAAILNRAIAILESFLYTNSNNTNQLRINTSQKLPLKALTRESLPTQNPETVDPWLTLNDLFGESQQIPPELEETETNITPPEIAKIPPAQNWRNPYQQIVKKIQSNTELVEQQSLSLDITPVTTNSSLSPSEAANNQLETNQEWIDTQAKMVGYAQHPLERILQFLDNGMLWLEEKIIKVFKIIQRLWRRR